MDKAKRTLVSFGMAFLLAFTMLGIAPLQAIAAEGEALKADVNEDGGYVYDAVYGVNGDYAVMVKAITVADDVYRDGETTWDGTDLSGQSRTKELVQTDIVKSDGTVTARSLSNDTSAETVAETDFEIDAASFGQFDSGLVKFKDKSTNATGAMNVEGDVVIPAEYGAIMFDGTHQLAIATKFTTTNPVVCTVDAYSATGAKVGSVEFETPFEAYQPENDKYSVGSYYGFSVMGDFLKLSNYSSTGVSDTRYIELSDQGITYRPDIIAIAYDSAVNGRLTYDGAIAVLRSEGDGSGQAAVTYYDEDGASYDICSDVATEGMSPTIWLENGIVSVQLYSDADRSATTRFFDVENGAVRDQMTVSGFASVDRVGDKYLVAYLDDAGRSGTYSLKQSLSLESEDDIELTTTYDKYFSFAGDYYARLKADGTGPMQIFKPDQDANTEDPFAALDVDIKSPLVSRVTPAAYAIEGFVGGVDTRYYDMNFNELSGNGVEHGIGVLVEAGEINGESLYFYLKGSAVGSAVEGNATLDETLQPVVVGGYTLTPTWGGIVNDEATVQRGDMYYATDGNGKYGAVRADGSVAIPFEYDGVEDMGKENTDLILLKQSDAWYFFDTEAGEIVLPSSGGTTDPEPGGEEGEDPEPAPDPGTDPDPDPEPTPDPDPTPVPTPDPKPEVDVVENPDGSTTTTVKDPDGTVTETTERPDGSSTEKVERPDGTASATETTAAGVAATVETGADGAVSKVTATVPAEAAEAAEGPVELPVPQVAADGSASLEVSAPAGTKVLVPVAAAGGEGAEPSPGTVVVVVAPDGTETVLPKSAVSGGSVVAELPGDCTIVVEDRSADFPDMVGTEWYAEQGVADFMSSRGIITGVETPEGSLEFQGDAPLDRGMMATLLYRVEGEPEVSGEGSFGDVEGGQWYTDAAEWAASAGVVTGYEGGEDDGDFGAADPVTREQMAAMLFRYAGALGVDTSARADLSATPDGASASGFAAEAMSWAVAEGIFRGDDGTGAVRPLDGATRAEASVVVMRFVELILGA